ncbi:MFS transporter [Halovenus sp. WSH3]|uniref:Lysosomal dipeptide transporter MFSD1 n=1 Tax=Halovenus carboxidivorans TaxID=2692199 RepID=A0A6B0TA30_9EURY|nr:MFS transporter [Halovenus carboxidivorans]MXR51740.1 MFS transporter [Halovenus carboxidivorans]
MSYWSSATSRRWLLWGLLAASYLLVNTYRLSTAVVAEQLMDAFAIAGAQLGTLHASFFLIYAVMQIPTGVLVDSVGPRRTAAVGGLGTNVGAVVFALAPTYPVAFAGRFLIGLSGSVIFVSMLRFCANWYTAEEFGTMNGVSFAVAGMGGIVATTPFALLVGAAGWRSSVILLASAGFGFAVLVYLFVRDSPERAGLDPIEGVPEPPRPSGAESWAFLKQVVRDRLTWAVFVILFCAGGVNLTLFGLWGIPYIRQVYGTTVTTASLFTLLGGIGAVVGPPFFGWLSDQTGLRTEIVVAGGVLYTTVLTIIAVFGDPPLAVVGVAFFLTGGLLGAFVLTYPLIKERNPDRASGIALGTINGASFLGAAVFPSAMGLILDSYWTGELSGGARVYTTTGYRVAFGLAAVAALLALCCALWLHRHDDGAVA